MSRNPDALFTPVALGDLMLSNRIVMAPLTRNRASPGSDAPHALNAEYYAQRAGAGLIVSEGTQISRQGQGYVWTPGLYSEAQVAGWREVTNAVHAASGRIFAQIWHVGRVSHVSLQENAVAPVAPSAIPAKTKTYIESGFAAVSEPRALALDEIPGIVADFVRAAENARRAGFDGVELHGANGYLLDQFVRDGANKRMDHYGGSIENRVRLPLQVIEALLKIWSAKRIGYRMSPSSPSNDIGDSAPQSTFGYLVEQLDRLGVGYIHVVEGATGGDRDVAPFDFRALRRAFFGVYIANNGYTRDLALDALESGAADLIAFGRPFIANPDLVERFRIAAPLNELDKTRLYGGGAEGYTDYPTLREIA